MADAGSLHLQADVAALAEIESIRQLKYRYMRCVDTKDFAGLAECFAKEARVEYSGGKFSYSGREVIIAWLRKALAPDVQSQHLALHPEIELTGPSTATGRWALQDRVFYDKGRMALEGAGFYEDAYVKVGGEWKIAYTGYRRTYEYRRGVGEFSDS